MGWTWEYIGECMTLPRLAAMSEHWKQYPPVHKAVAAYLGIKPAPKTNVVPITNADLTRDMHVDTRKIKWQTKESNG
jgi:hypothetical protein